MSDLEATAYEVPCFDCPACGEVNAMFGQDDILGDQECAGCGQTVDVVQ